MPVLWVPGDRFGRDGAFGALSAVDRDLKLWYTIADLTRLGRRLVSLRGRRSRDACRFATLAAEVTWGSPPPS
jgi:hypothetical protein